MKNLFTSLIISCLLTACASDEISIPASDFNLAKNETFKINLASNPTTGYSWKWTNKSDINIVDTLKVDYVMNNTDPNIVGGGGTEIWNFKAIKSGTKILKFEYCRSWENNSTVETKTFVVNVK